MSFHPQTPQSPSQVSPSTSSDAINSLACSQTSTTITLPTPAHSVSGSASLIDIAMADDSPNKRKRAADDQDDGDRHQKKLQTEEQYKMGIEDLHLDVGEKYLLCHNSHPESLPRPTDDLYELFNLTALAASLAREKPNGEKNALRKTFKGHMKRLGVAGQFEPHKKPEDTPSEFMELVMMPQDNFDVHFVQGKEIGAGLSDSTLSLLGRAMTMTKGSIPKTLWDSSVLGDLTPLTADASRLSSKPTTPGTPLAATPSTFPRPKHLGMSAHDPLRPKRNMKKRAYGDSSFDGYGEGFPDDDGGYSTADGDAAQKRRKKSAGNASPYPQPVRQHSYGPGMVGA